MEERKEEPVNEFRQAVITRGPPRWKAPIAREKVRTAPPPPNFVELLETLAVAPSSNGPVIGEGTGVAPPNIDPAGAPRVLPRVIEPKPTREPIEKKPEPIGVPLAQIKGELPPVLSTLKTRLESLESKQKVEVKPDVYVPSNRKSFKQFIIQNYRKYFLPPIPDIPDPDACAKAIASSKSEVKSFAYQSFVRDYMQRPSPYRGVLVYHGLGSGKTCTSIAAMEAIQQADRTKPVFVLTPASLNPNYRDEITKCGPFIFRTNNHWVFISVPRLADRTPEAQLLISFGIPSKSISKRRGGWLPDPAKPPNFDSLSADDKKAIQEQIYELMDERIQFINYNGLQEKTVRNWACNTPNKFDGAVMVIDEVHNLVRTINNAQLDLFYKDEPRDLAQYMPKFCETGQKYRISYLLYRMLCNSVGLKIIALSATPIINFPQEIAVLANLLAGDTRMVEATTPGLDRRIAIEKALIAHPEVDFAEVTPRPETGTTFVRITPVPSGNRKVIDPTTGAFLGYVRQEAMIPLDTDRERQPEKWIERVNNTLISSGLPQLSNIKYKSIPRLPDIEKVFREMFIDTEKLTVKAGLEIPLIERLSGLISYYKGGKADLMAKVTTDEIVLVDMSDLQLKRYTDERVEEIDKEQKQSRKKKTQVVAQGRVDYEQATKNINSTFKIFSRAACNFAFPDEVERPVPRDFRDAMKMIGARPGQEDIVTGDVEAIVDDTTEVVGDDGVPIVEAEAPPVAAAAAANAIKETYETAIVSAITTLRANKERFFSPESLSMLSPKFQAIIDRIKPSKGPVLVYSNFKTLEGIGLFSVALEAQFGMTKLDVEQTALGWKLTDETLSAPIGSPRYIVYTGDEKREKRKLLLDIFNNKWSKVPPALAMKVKEITGVETNIGGGIAKVFMITQSGAEGISLANVRQVHIMEPYWNYVRLDQVKGRAIRICSHMELPPDERTVDVFTYVSKFSTKQLKERKVDETLMNFDEGETTDQNILKLMNAKKQLADSILDIMKSSAVDCELNHTENGTVACYRLPNKTADAHMFHPITEVHLSSATSVRVRAV